MQQNLAKRFGGLIWYTKGSIIIKFGQNLYFCSYQYYALPLNGLSLHEHMISMQKNMISQVYACMYMYMYSLTLF